MNCSTERIVARWEWSRMNADSIAVCWIGRWSGERKKTPRERQKRALIVVVVVEGFVVRRRGGRGYVLYAELNLLRR